MKPSIPIENIYYLLCYAWNRLDQSELIDVSAVSNSELADLFAFVLNEGVRQLTRRGLEQGYVEIEDDIPGVRGRADLSTSARRSLMIRGRLVCRFDELTSDTRANRILKSSLLNLSRIASLNKDLRRRVRRTCRDLHGVAEVKLAADSFQSVRVSANQRFYRFLLNVCELAHECLLVDEEVGDFKFRDFTRDEARMAKLFQEFLFNFVVRECPHWTARVENIPWQAASDTDPELALLPRMQTDISLRRQGEYLIVDAKYYRDTLSRHFDTEKLHSQNLYQIVSYLSNAPAQLNVWSKGMLIYPRVLKTLREHYTILGHPLSINTVDLSQPWQSVRCELISIFA